MLTSTGENNILKFCVLASGSSGNSAFIATKRTRVLVDAGLSFRELSKRLAAIGEQPDRIDAILVTHEHCDHIAGLARFARRVPVPIYVTRLTAPVIEWDGFTPRLEPFQAGARFAVGDIEIDSFSIPHDAVDPVGFAFRADGIKIGLVTDLGYIPDSIKFHLRGSQVLMLESNHDLDMLKVGPYPWAVKQRVMSRNGHLSNDVVGDFVSHEFDSGTATLILGHLSEHNNHPEIARMVARQALDRRGLATQLVVASQKEPTEVFTF
ncbi:MAG TPA: MBL fold metallo-hydrolase [Bryobacteraceae bacterium]|nr:MBL fold metallo-hydrolase [Bryobacteraceae bacterium]